jgi:Bacterial regulatory proteins, tetR family
MCQHRAMNRKRLTREDSREATRKHLMDAAQRLTAKKGLSTTSVEDIAESAGYTRGAFYSNFIEDLESVRAAESTSTGDDARGSLKVRTIAFRC